MQITFDTAVDSLDDVLAMLSRAYGVEVTLGTASARIPRVRAAKRAAGSARTGPGRATSRSAASGASAKTVNAIGKTPAPRRGRRAGGANVSPAGQSGLIRAWAKSRGLAVGDAGRLSASVIAAYQAAHSRTAAKAK